MNDEIAAMSRAELERTIVELSASCYVWKMACEQWRETATAFQLQARQAQDVAFGMRCAVDVDKGEAFARLTETVN